MHLLSLFLRAIRLKRLAKKAKKGKVIDLDASRARLKVKGDVLLCADAKKR